MIYNKASYAAEEVIINLFESYCLPITTYACESIFPIKSDANSLNKLISIAFYKNFHTYDTNVINAARLHFGLGDITDILNIRYNRFLTRYYNKSLHFVPVIRSMNFNHVK